jgi:hypothetical protein
MHGFCIIVLRVSCYACFEVYRLLAYVSSQVFCLDCYIMCHSFFEVFDILKFECNTMLFANS